MLINKEVTLECRIHKERGSNPGWDDLYQLIFSTVFLILLKKNPVITANNIADPRYFKLVSLITAWSDLLREIQAQSIISLH